ncbi:MAG: GNAT family N-acetyltransferase [Bacteriovoracaceae bacterium]|nr:GNAT family N-acetyltransferase [Bacteriovoracaceae bacterium]
MNVETIVGLVLFNTTLEDSWAHLLKLLIIPKYRGERVGGKFFKVCINYMKQHSFKKFYLEVENSNSAAISLYLDAGFELTHTKNSYYGKKRDALIMEC